jgi:anti-sigma factor RsiW
MICDEVRHMSGACVDKELELTRQPDLEKHLAGCPSCQAAAEEIKNFSSLILMNIPVYKAPGELKAKIQASLRRESRPKLEWFSRVSLPLAYAAALLFVSFAVPWTWRTFSLAKDQALVAQAISNHVRSLIAAHLADVYSSDEHTVKAWFTGKLDYSPQVVDLAERGFPLIGGRIDMLDQRPVAAIVYQHGNHLINLFVWPVASRKIDLDVQSDRDYRFCGWNKAGLNYLCISEGSAIALEEFEDEVRERTNL